MTTEPVRCLTKSLPGSRFVNNTGSNATNGNTAPPAIPASKVNVEVFYVHPDHLGPPRVITACTALAATTGTGIPSAQTVNKAVWRWDSDPFGSNATANSAPNENPNTLSQVVGTSTLPYLFGFDLAFPGQKRDRETGKHYNYFRDYDPAVGRYFESDPIGLRGGVSTYSFVVANPVSRYDPSGLFSWSDVGRAWEHYCDGTGTSWTAGFGSIDWGTARVGIEQRIASKVGNRCRNLTIPIGFDYGAQAAGADAYIIGRHSIRVKGILKVKCDCTWSFSGTMSSALGRDPYDFDSSHRGVVGESLTWLGRNRCPEDGTPFDIYLPGSEALSYNGKVQGASSCECGQN